MGVLRGCRSSSHPVLTRGYMSQRCPRPRTCGCYCEDDGWSAAACQLDDPSLECADRQGYRPEMVLFEVEAELSPPENASYGQISKIVDELIVALDIRSGAFCLHEYGLIMAGFTLDAVSYRQALRQGVDRIASAARTVRISEEPVTLRILRRSTAESRSSERAAIECTCNCHDEESRMGTSM
jgi:hypothetical protein